MKEALFLALGLMIALFLSSFAMAATTPYYQLTTPRALNTCIAACGTVPPLTNLAASYKYEICVDNCKPLYSNISNYFGKQTLFDVFVSLQNQIKNVTSVQGPVGPIGPKGNTGATGSQGMPGVNGTNGINGKNAYQLAVENGFVGDLDIWLTSLIGPKGDEGKQGPQGEIGPMGPAGPQGDSATCEVTTEMYDALLARVAALEANMPTIEICDGKDNDVDGYVDEGFNVQTDRMNCGTCGNVCEEEQTCNAGTCTTYTQICTLSDVDIMMLCVDNCGDNGPLCMYTCSGGQVSGECQDAFTSLLSCATNTGCSGEDQYDLFLCLQQQCYPQYFRVFGAKPEGYPCTDGDFCTVNEAWNNGVCTSTTPKSCNDGNDCTSDTCDSTAQTCTNAPVSEGSGCDDRNPCTLNDVCNAGMCGGVIEDPDCEPDYDEDGYLPPEDCNNNAPEINPGAPEFCDSRDNDCDGVTDENPDEICGEGLVCDGGECMDTCGNDICEPFENMETCVQDCPDTTTDSDGDGVPDYVDNCPAISNPAQEDTNGFWDNNGQGDACEPMPCTDDNGCASDHYCVDGGYCAPRVENSWECTRDEMCLSGNCIDTTCRASGECTSADTASCYTQSLGTLNVGQCVAGTKTCSGAGFWGSCLGEVTPTPEICDGKDNDCDGQADESCASDCTTPTEIPGCSVPAIESCVCNSDQYCCEIAWDDVCVAYAMEHCSADTDGDGLLNILDPDDDNDGIPDIEDGCPLNPDPLCTGPDAP
jgi:Notch 1